MPLTWAGLKKDQKKGLKKPLKMIQNKHKKKIIIKIRKLKNKKKIRLKNK